MNKQIYIDLTPRQRESLMMDSSLLDSLIDENKLVDYEIGHKKLMLSARNSECSKLIMRALKKTGRA